MASMVRLFARLEQNAHRSTHATDMQYSGLFKDWTQMTGCILEGPGVFARAENGILRTSEFEDVEWDEIDRLARMGDVLRIHEWSYIQRIQVGMSPFTAPMEVESR